MLRHRQHHRSRPPPPAHRRQHRQYGPPAEPHPVNTSDHDSTSFDSGVERVASNGAQQLASPTHQIRRRSSSHNGQRDLPSHPVSSSSATPTTTTASDGSYTIVYHRIRWLRRPTEQSQYGSSPQPQDHPDPHNPREIENAFNYLPVPAPASSFQAIREAAEAQIPVSGTNERLWEWDNRTSEWILHEPNLRPRRVSESRQGLRTEETQQRTRALATDKTNQKAHREDYNKEESRFMPFLGAPPLSSNPIQSSNRVAFGTEKPQRRREARSNENEGVRQSTEHVRAQRLTATPRARSMSESKSLESLTPTSATTTSSSKSSSPLANPFPSSERHHGRHRSVSQASHQATSGRDDDRGESRTSKQQYRNTTPMRDNRCHRSVSQASHQATVGLDNIRGEGRASKRQDHDSTQPRDSRRSSVPPEDRDHYKPRYVEPSAGRRAGQRVRFTPSTKGVGSAHADGSPQRDASASTKDSKGSRR